MSINHRRIALLAPLALIVAASSALAGGFWSRFDHATECERCRLAWLELAGEEAADNLRYSEDTGADTANYAPSRKVDYRNMRLDIDIPDMNNPRFSATQVLEFAPVGKPLESLTLNAEQLDIRGVSSLLRGQNVSFSHDGSQLNLAFDPPIPTGESTTIQIAYEANDPVDGLFWTPEAPEWPGRAAQIHTQGQPETNRFWFPAHDSPNERLTTEIVITVPEGYVASSNGELVDQRTRDGRTTFHWRQTPEHVSYLVSLVVGKFDIVDVGNRDLSMPVYVPPGKGKYVQQTYGSTAEMVPLYERLFGLEYPWARYAQLVVWNFGAGGMENTSATTMYDTAILDDRALEDGDLDSLIAHELVHQWYGDLITCNTWAHIWLNEGFATYGSALWFEERDGYDNGYLTYMHRTMRGLAERDAISASDSDGWKRPPMVSRLYEHPWEVFRRRSNPYPKGASTLHMLRSALGDDLFFQGIQTYTRRYANQTVETDQFRRVLEEVSGRSLEQFFDQWCFRPGTPQVDVDIKWSESDKNLTITVEQTQRIDEFLPAYAFDLPVYIETNGESRTVTIPVMNERHERVIQLEAEPSIVAVDPHLHVLMNPTVRQPARRFINQLQSGPTMASKLDAVAALSETPGDDSEAALVAVRHDSTIDHTLREAAAIALGDLDATEALLEIARAGVSDARVRESVMRALAVVGGDEALQILADAASDPDESYAVQAAALRGVGDLGNRDHLPILLAALERDSQHEQVRSAALRALADLGEPEGLEAAIPYTQFGWLQRLRPAAIDAVAELSEHDVDAAVDALIPILRDREWRPRRAAADALVQIGDDRALPELQRLARTHPHPRHREDFAEAADRLAAAARRDDPSSGLRREVETLKRELDDLRRQIEDGKG
ncbi:MAG: M1 family aminopeptidase, partial [Planctomycetota bacterium]|nr:M1 family aminopeptidase [Planctomycetota bacterium]